MGSSIIIRYLLMRIKCLELGWIRNWRMFSHWGNYYSIPNDILLGPKLSSTKTGKARIKIRNSFHNALREENLNLDPIPESISERESKSGPNSTIPVGWSTLRKECWIFFNDKSLAETKAQTAWRPMLHGD